MPTPNYSVRIRYPNGNELNVRVTRERLEQFRLCACRNASILIVKVRS